MNEDLSEMKVTICCAVYNHEHFLRDTLEGFVNQKTTFDYEILINDDCSTDGSVEIIREYQRKYPKLIRVIYQTENQYSQGKKVFFDLLVPHVQGKYIAICEGDDIWSDVEKLQRQYEIMEEYEDCVLCTHTVRDIDKDGQLLANTYPDGAMKEGLYTSEEMMQMLFSPLSYPFQTSSFFIRSKAVQRFGGKYPAFISASGVGDVPLTWLLADEGNLYYIDREMSMYRRDVAGSWSVRMQSRAFRKQHFERVLYALKAYDEYTHRKYSDLITNDIVKLEFDLLRVSDNYEQMKLSRYKGCFKSLSLKERVGYYIFMKCPCCRALYERIRGLKNG